MTNGYRQWPQQPPPYQPIIEPSTSQSYSENDPLLSQSRTHHKSDLKGVLWKVFAILLLGSFFGYLFDRSYNYNLYEKLWRNWSQEEEHRASIRAQWVEEVAQHEVQRLRMEEDITKWKVEKAVMEAERKRWEEERERKRAHLVWEDVHSGRCLRYGTREYKATLSNVGTGLDGMLECSNKPLSIHGRDFLPTFCNFEGPCKHVTGHWTIDSDVSCSPWWDTPSDKGCDSMHKRRFDAHLINVSNREDWETLCKTTPAIINGIPYDGAMSCVDSVWGVFGIWFVEDKNCF